MPFLLTGFVITFFRLRDKLIVIKGKCKIKYFFSEKSASALLGCYSPIHKVSSYRKLTNVYLTNQNSVNRPGRLLKIIIQVWLRKKLFFNQELSFNLTSIMEIVPSVSVQFKYWSAIEGFSVGRIVLVPNIRLILPIVMKIILFKP